MRWFNHRHAPVRPSELAQQRIPSPGIEMMEPPSLQTLGLPAMGSLMSWERCPSENGAAWRWPSLVRALLAYYPHVNGRGRPPVGRGRMPRL